MGDFKSKLPDLKELGSMTEKLFKGIKSSVTEIIDDYKKKRETLEKDETAKTEEKLAENAKSSVQTTKEEAPKVDKDPDAKS